MESFSIEGAALIIGGDLVATEALEAQARWALQAEGLDSRLANRLANGGPGWHRAWEWSGWQDENARTPLARVYLDLWRWALHLLEGGRFAPFGVERALDVLTLVEGQEVPVVEGRQAPVHARKTWALWESLALAD